MKENIRQERLEKFQRTIIAALDHLERAKSTLEDANLYTSDDQEQQVDTLVTRIEDLIKDVRHYLL